MEQLQRLSLTTTSKQEEEEKTIENNENEAEEDGDMEGINTEDTSSMKKKKKKKKKKKAKQDKQNMAMPSQKLVEAFFPMEIAEKPKCGRSAVASRFIKAGEVVVAEKALAFVARSNYRLTVCHNCCTDLSQREALECPTCKFAVYCKECENQSMPLHTKWCSVYSMISRIAKQTDCDEDLLHLVLLLAMKRGFTDEEEAIEPAKVEEGVLYPSFQDAMALQMHWQKVSPSWKNSVRKSCEGLHSHIRKTLACLRCTEDDLELLAVLINTNAHGMGAQGLQNTDIALGIFPFVSMLNHSCRPNCCFSSENNVMFVRTIQDVPKGSELCVSYINLYESRYTRRLQLASSKHFECSCTRCTEPLLSSIDRFLEGVACSVKGCGGVLVKRSSTEKVDGTSDESLSCWECSMCSHVLDPGSSIHQSRPLMERPWDLMTQAQKKFMMAISVYNERNFKVARMLFEEFISEFTGKLHPLHVLLFDALTPLMNCCRALGDADGGIRACRNIISCLEKVLSGTSLELANFYFCLGEMCSERADACDVSPVLIKHYKKQAQEAFRRVRQIRSICLGKPSLPA